MKNVEQDYRFKYYNSLKPEKNHYAKNYKHLKNENRYDYLYLMKLAGPMDGKIILDSACATGDLLSYIEGKGACCFGIDYSRPFIYKANEAKPGNHHFCVCNAQQISFEAASFDIIFSSHFVEHLHEEELLRYFREIYRVIKPGGKFIIHTCPNKLYRYIVYKYYTRWVRMVLYPILNLFLKNKITQIPSPDEFKKQVLEKKENKLIHVNEKSVKGLSISLKNAGFENAKVWAYGEPFTFNLWMLPIYMLELLYPFPKIFPSFFTNHVWALYTKDR